MNLLFSLPNTVSKRMMFPSDTKFFFLFLYVSSISPGLKEFIVSFNTIWYPIKTESLIVPLKHATAEAKHAKYHGPIAIEYTVLRDIFQLFSQRTREWPSLYQHLNTARRIWEIVLWIRPITLPTQLGTKAGWL